jgi:branched-chain amino acid transport system substrate-binding protein
MRYLLLTSALLVPMLGSCSGGKKEDPNTVRIGVIFPMTGDTATFGEECWNGMRLAEEEIRATGAPAPFRLILKDDKSNKQEAGSQAKALIDTEGVHVILGSVASSNTIQIAQEAKEAGVPLITPASTNDLLTQEAGEYVSRICFKDSVQGSVLANFALEHGWKKAALAVDEANAYSTGLAKNFKDVYEKGGGTLTLDHFSQGDKDFSNLIQNVANHDPDVIFISGYYGQGGPMIRQAKGKWDGKPIIAGDGLDSPELISLVGDTKTELYLSTHFAADAPDPEIQAWAKRYKDKYGQLPGAMAALGYDVLAVLMDAVKRCKDPKDRKELALRIRETKVKGITGMMDLTTPDRTPSKDLVIVKIDGGLKYVATIKAPR